MVAEEIGGQERRQAQHRADRQVDVAREDDHRLAEREQREDRRVDEDELDVREVEEARLDARGHEHEQDEHGDDAELPQRGRRARRAGADRGEPRRRPGGVGAVAVMRRRLRGWPVAAATIDSSDASACANSATSRPSRMTRIRSASRSTSGQLGGDHQDRDALSPAQLLEQAVHLRLRADVDAAGGLVDDQQRRLARRATWPARPSAGCRPTARSSGSASRPYLTWSRVAQSRANRRSAAALMNPARRSRRNDASVMLRPIDMSIDEPLLAPVLGNEGRRRRPWRAGRRAAAQRGR